MRDPACAGKVGVMASSLPHSSMGKLSRRRGIRGLWQAILTTKNALGIAGMKTVAGVADAISKMVMFDSLPKGREMHSSVKA